MLIIQYLLLSMVTPEIKFRKTGALGLSLLSWSRACGEQP